MKNVIVLLAVLVLGANAHAQSSCYDIFSVPAPVVVAPAPATVEAKKEDKTSEKKAAKPKDALTLEELKVAAKELTEQMSSLESKIEWWSNLTGQYERSSLFKLRERRRKFEFYFKTSRELSEAVNIYRDVFKDTEFSFLKLKNYYKTPVAERDAVMSKEELAAVEKTFGENYGDYKFIRQYLEGILKTEPIDATSAEGILYSNAKYVFGRLGVPVISERFHGLREELERPTIAEIELVFRRTPGPLIAKLKRDLREERVLAFRTFVSSLLQIQTLQKMVYKILPKKLKEPVTAFLGLNYNSYVLKRYLSDISLIVEAKTPENQLIVFREIAAKHSSQEFYVTFARLVSYSEIWINLRKEVESRKDEPIYARLLEDMQKAEADLKNYSFLPQFHTPSLIDHFTKWVAPAGIGAATYAYADFNAVKQGVLETFQYISTMLPF